MKFIRFTYRAPYYLNHKRYVHKFDWQKKYCLIFNEFICKLSWKISIWSKTTFHLNTLWYIRCCQWQRSNIFCNSSQDFHTLLLVFWPLPQCRSPLEQWRFGAVDGQHGFSTPKIFYGVVIWRLARQLQDLEMLLMKPLLRCPGGVFGIIVMLKEPATFHLQCPNADGRRFSFRISRYMAPFILSLTRINRPGPFAEK